MSELLNALRNATEEDLQAVRTRIMELSSELCSLKMAEKLLSTRLGATGEGKEMLRTGQKPRRKENLEERRLRVAHTLLELGAVTRKQLAEATNIAFSGQGCITQVLNCDYFHSNPDGIVTLTESRERAVRASAKR